MLTVILTGGMSHRMGRDKALLPVDAEPMSRMLARRYSVLGPVAFSVDRAGRFDCAGYPELPDAFPGLGPLNGLYSAFTRTDESTVFLTATDMPNGDPALVRTLCDGLDGYDACIIERRSGQREPLFGVFARSSLPKVEEALAGERRSLYSALSRMNVHYFMEGELSEWDLEHILTNLNTPEAYESFLRGREAAR